MSRGYPDDAMIIPITRRDGSIRTQTIVSSVDYEYVVAEGKWSSNARRGGVVYRRKLVNGKQVDVKLHRFILDAPEGSIVDHIDGNPLNNTRENLRFVSHHENTQNRRHSSGRSMHRGVTYEKGLRGTKKWRARHTLSGKMIHIGIFLTEEEAGKAAAEWRSYNMPGSIEWMEKNA